MVYDQFVVSITTEILGRFKETKVIYFSCGNGVGMAEGAAGKEGSPLGDSQAIVMPYFRHCEVLDFPTTLSGVQRGNCGPDKTKEF